MDTINIQEESLPDFLPTTERYIKMFEQILDMNDRVLTALEQIGQVPMVFKTMSPKKENND